MAFIHLLLVIYAFVHVNMETINEAVQCNLCVDRYNWTNCDDSAVPRECSEKLVLATHNYLSQYNVNLNGSSTVADRQFRCFRLELEIDVTTVQVFIRGCTYDDSFFCDGWTENGARATNCAVCSTDMCERNTTGDVVATTTTYLPPEVTTTTAVSTVETSAATQTTSVTHSTSTTQTASPTYSTSTTHSTSTTQTNPVTATVTTDAPCIVDWSTVKGQSTTTSSQGQVLTTNSTDSSQSGNNATLVPIVLSTTDTSAAGGYFEINKIIFVLLASIGSVFVV